MAATTSTTSYASSIGTIVRNAVLAIIVAVITNVIIRFIATGVLGVPETALPMQIGAIILFTVLGIAIGAVIYTIITRVSGNPPRTWQIVAIVALLLSLIPVVSLGSGAAPPFPMPDGMTMPEGTPALLTALISMHFGAGIPSILLQPRP